MFCFLICFFKYTTIEFRSCLNLLDLWKPCHYFNNFYIFSISGSRVLGRLKKSCKCCGNPDIYAIHLLPTAYPSKKLANSREKKKKKTNLKKNISRFNGGAQNSTYSHSFCLREKTSNQFEKFFFPLPLFFVINFLLLQFFLFLQIFTSNLKRKETS